MSRVFSFRDLKRIPELSNFSEIELIHPRHDQTMRAYLYVLGFDIMKPIYYVPAMHRDLSNNVAIGFMAVGDIRTGAVDYLNSPLADEIERLIVIARKDMSLAVTLARMMGHSVDLTDDSLDTEDCNLPEEYWEPTADADAATILALTVYRDSVRGDERDESGFPKVEVEEKGE